MKYLNIVSVFPAVTETFVYREIRTAQRMGCEVVIAPLRPGRKRLSESDDLLPSVVRSPLFSWSTLFGTMRFAVTQPRLVAHYARLALAGFPRLGGVFKLGYILLVSMGLAHRLRSAGIRHVRGHHLHSEAVAAMFISGCLDIPYSFTCHTVKTYYPDRVIRRVIRDSSFILANIGQVKRFLLSRGASASQVQLVRNGVPLAEFRLRPAGFEANPPTILAVGRLDYKKGFHILLSACALLRDEGIHFRCVIVGDGDERAELRSRRRSLGLEGRVEFTGSLSFAEVQRWYECATLLAVPSVVAPDGATDGMPTVIIEALARGVPVVGSATAGIPEAVQNGVNGFVVAPGSVRELAVRIRELLGDPEPRRKFALEGRKTAERDFDLDRNVRQLVRLMSEPDGGELPEAPLPAFVPAARALQNQDLQNHDMENPMPSPKVSVIIPIRNEEKYIAGCLESLLRQSCPHDLCELIVVDGRSSDRSPEIVQEIRRRHANVLLLDNPAGIVPCGMNLGIRQALGEVIVRADGHNVYPPDYIENCVRYLDQTGADNVGGPLVTVPADESVSARLVAAVLTSPFGVGNSAFRTGAVEGFVETVPFGAFRRELFGRIGMYNERLVRNQDNELNARIRQAGGKIFQTPALSTQYHPVGGFLKLLTVTFRTSQWHLFSMKENSHAMSPRHLAPALFAITLSVMLLASAVGVVGLLPLELLLLAYLAAGFALAVLHSRTYGPAIVLVLPVACLCFHMAYGLGTLAGLRFLIQAPSARPIREGRPVS